MITWVCRRDPSITLPYSELILHTRTGVPYLAPEVVLLFKAKHLRPKDRHRFRRRCYLPWDASDGPGCVIGSPRSIPDIDGSPNSDSKACDGAGRCDVLTG